MKNRNSVKRRISQIGAFAFATLLMAAPVRASGLTDSTIYTGTSALIADLTAWAAGLCPVIGGLFAIVFAIRRSMADQQDGKMWQNRIVVAIICGVGGGLISGIISVIASYYT